LKLSILKFTVHGVDASVAIDDPRIRENLAIASIRTGGNNCASCNHRAAYFRAAATNRAAQGEAVNVSLAAVAHDVPVILAFFLSPDLS
jgi:hypothetical protein